MRQSPLLSNSPARTLKSQLEYTNNMRVKRNYNVPHSEYLTQTRPVKSKQLSYRKGQSEQFELPKPGGKPAQTQLNFYSNNSRATTRATNDPSLSMTQGTFRTGRRQAKVNASVNISGDYKLVSPL